MEKYFVPKIDTPLEGVVTVPGSKSMTNRALLLATLSEEESVLRGVLFSDDSRHFLACLQSLGFLLEIDENKKVVLCNSEKKDNLFRKRYKLTHGDKCYSIIKYFCPEVEFISIKIMEK